LFLPFPSRDNQIVKCPICKKPVAREDQHYPFCSERCQLIDLGNWASEKYVVSTPIRRPREDEETE
jgi:endogenous inhibitor of DNA gyrase (YacG/DUF329 family)